MCSYESSARRLCKAVKCVEWLILFTSHASVRGQFVIYILVRTRSNSGNLGIQCYDLDCIDLTNESSKSMNNQLIKCCSRWIMNVVMIVTLICESKDLSRLLKACKCTQLIWRCVGSTVDDSSKYKVKSPSFMNCGDKILTVRQQIERKQLSSILLFVVLAKAITEILKARNYISLMYHVQFLATCNSLFKQGNVFLSPVDEQ